MTPGCPPPEDAEAHEELLRRLTRSEASDAEIGEAAMDAMTYLLDIEHLHLAALHACQYGTFWDAARKLAILERFHEQGSDALAIMFCHRWKLSALCFAQKRQLFTKLFPPRNPDKKE